MYLRPPTTFLCCNLLCCHSGKCLLKALNRQVSVTFQLPLSLSASLNGSMSTHINVHHVSSAFVSKKISARVNSQITSWSPDYLKQVNNAEFLTFQYSRVSFSQECFVLGLVFFLPVCFLKLTDCVAAYCNYIFPLSSFHLSTFKLTHRGQGHNGNYAVRRQQGLPFIFIEAEGAFLCQNTFLLENNGRYFTGGWVLFSRQAW